jgi:tetratricopeptide (TPR) repeat protein
MAKNDKYKAQMPNGRMDAFNAFKKYYELDPKSVRGTLEQHVRLFDIYNQYFSMGVEGFNSSQFEDAYTNFKNAYTVEEYIAGKGWEYNGFKFAAFDTSLIQNIALSALKANKEEEAVVYYRRIADQKITGEDFVGVYDWLVKYYDKKGDNANREKYFQMAKELYPNIAWYEEELKKVDSKDKKALFAKYEEIMPKYPNEYFLYYNYAVELFNYADIADPKPADYKEMQAKLETILKKAIEIDKAKPEANFLMAVHYYNMIYDIQDEAKSIKGTTAADNKKKADINARAKETADKMLPYAMTAIDVYAAKEKLKASEKGNYKKLVGYVSDDYDLKGDKAKAEEFKKKGDSIQ